MDMSAKQLNDLRAAYSVGRLKPMMEIPENILELGLNRAELPPAEQELLQRCSRYRSAALQACREGKYAIAKYLLADTERLIQEGTFSPPGRLIAQSGYEAAIAYLDYRCGRFEIGTEHIYRALACDEKLEDMYGLTRYHMHRMRLLINLIHLKRYQGEEIAALRLSLALIDYLEQKASSLPYPTTWDSQCLDHLPFAAKNLLFEMAMCEMMFLIVGQEHHLTEWPAFLSRHTHATASSFCQLSPRAHLWLQAKQALQEHKLDRFCEIATPLIAAGPGELLWLWHGIAMDVVILCKDLVSEPAALLLQSITDDMSSWRWSKFPPCWKQIAATSSLHVHA